MSDDEFVNPALAGGDSDSDSDSDGEGGFVNPALLGGSSSDDDSDGGFVNPALAGGSDSDVHKNQCHMSMCTQINDQPRAATGRTANANGANCTQ